MRASWVILTTGNRPVELAAAVSSIRAGSPDAEIVVVANGADPATLVDLPVRVVVSRENLGVPAGRDAGLHSTTGDVVFFLDDDAVVEDAGAQQAVLDQFAREATLGAVSFRIVDESGDTSRRHVPRFGATRPDESGLVATFLGGACALRRDAYLVAGGYWGELWYGHEELDLAWRLIDRGYSIRYDAAVRVLHPRTTIERHPDGWRLTGRNRVLVARRNLPFVLAVLHVAGWTVLGSLRANGRASRRAYLSGVRSGVRAPVSRAPMTWSTVVALCRLGRPPVL